VQILELTGEQLIELPQATPAPPKKKPAERLQELIAQTLAPVNLKTDLFANFTLDKYSAEKMQPYSKHANTATMIIHAQKGVGKTEALVDLIQEQFRTKTIIALSHRRTFAAELQRQLPDFVNYESLAGKRIDPLVYPRVVVQVESMNKIDLSELMYHEYPVDLLIMDESESIIEQLGSGLDRHFAASWDVFNWLTLYSEHVIAMDANVTNRTISLLADHQANHYGNNECVLVQNTYERAADFEYKLTLDQSHWRAQLFQDLAEGLQVVIPINSAKEAKALHKDILAKYPNMDIKLYTGETDPNVKRGDIENINTAWACQVLIYTPTITSGVSFKLDNFDKIYAWFHATSCSVLACDQMMGRVRSISTNSAVVFLDHTATENRLSTKQIRNSMLTSRENLYAAYGAKWLSYETGPADLKIHNKRYFNVCVSNEAAMNRTRSDFMGEFVRLVKRTGTKVSLLENVAVVAAIEERHAKSKEEVAQENIQRIVSAPDIDPEQLAALKDKAEKTPEENDKLSRAFLRQTYKWTGEIDVAFVKTYDDEKQKQWYRNLNAIKEHTLGEIQAAERELHEAHGDRAYDWNKTYYFEHHRIAQSVLTALGFEGLEDPSKKTPTELTAAIAAHRAEFEAQYDHVVATLKLRSKKLNLGNSNRLYFTSMRFCEWCMV
jgi:hypothetical protein